MTEDDDDVSAMWRDHRKAVQNKREKNLAAANPDGWKKHTAYHWSRELNGYRLDYWPSRNKFQYRGKVMVGDIDGFIRNRGTKPT